MKDSFLFICSFFAEVLAYVDQVCFKQDGDELTLRVVKISFCTKSFYLNHDEVVNKSCLFEIFKAAQIDSLLHVFEHNLPASMAIHADSDILRATVASGRLVLILLLRTPYNNLAACLWLCHAQKMVEQILSLALL